MNSNYDFGIALSLNNWDIEDITYNEMPELGPRWTVRVRFHNIHSQAEAIAKLGELKADAGKQELVIDHATVRTYVPGEPVTASVVILEPGSKSAIFTNTRNHGIKPH